MAYYVVVTSYAMLPVRRRSFCVALGVVTGLAHLAVFTVAALLRSTNHLAFQVKYREWKSSSCKESTENAAVLRSVIVVLRPRVCDSLVGLPPHAVNNGTPHSIVVCVPARRGACPRARPK